jgi:hypothetical protein
MSGREMVGWFPQRANRPTLSGRTAFLCRLLYPAGLAAFPRGKLFRLSLTGTTRSSASCPREATDCWNWSATEELLERVIHLIVADWGRYVCGFWAAAEDDAAMRRPLLALGWIGALDGRCRT